MVSPDVLERLSCAVVYDLGLPLEATTPHSPAHASYTFSVAKMHGEQIYTGGVSFTNDVFQMGTHTGTHMDALGHVSVDGLLAEGYVAAQVQTKNKGLSRCGIDEVPPFFGRGLMLDVASAVGVTALEPAYTITPADLERAEAAANLTIGPGDAVLIRTGWLKQWLNGGRRGGPEHGLPGPGLDGARWLSDRGAALVGSDTIAFEQRPTPGFPVHVFLLKERQIPIIEFLYLERLAEQRVTEFLFVVIPLNIVGGSGSPVRPIAVIL